MSETLDKLAALKGKILGAKNGEAIKVDAEEVELLRQLGAEEAAKSAQHSHMYCGIGCTLEEYNKLTSMYQGLGNDEFSVTEVEETLAKMRGTKAVAPTAASVESTLAERGARYGDFSDHARLCQDLKDVMQGFTVDNGLKMPWAELPAVHKQALEVIADKIARILSGDPNYADNWHDIQGYAKLVEDRLPKGNHQ